MSDWLLQAGCVVWEQEHGTGVQSSHSHNREQVGPAQDTPLTSPFTPVLPPLQSNMKVRPVLTLLMVLGSVGAQFEEDEELYRGQLIGSLNSYHHQVSESPQLSQSD